MRVLIFAFLALAANAANYGYDSYGSGYPSYSYSSYPSSYYGGYGSSLYGATYGTGLGYGSGATYGTGYGYGSGATYGTGLGYGSGATYGYAAAYKPAVYQTARYSYRQPQGTWGEKRSGYSSSGTPGKIEFVLGGAGYKTGTSDYLAPVLPKPAGGFTRGSTSVHRSGGALDGATGRISFTQDFSRVSGQPGFQRSRGTVGASNFRKPAAPVSVVTEKHSGVFTGQVGSLHKTGVQGDTDSVSQVHFQETTDVSGNDFTGAGFGGISSSQAVLPKRPSGHQGFSAVHKSTSGPTGPQISFTRDFSKVIGHSGITGRQPQIHSFDKVSAPLETTFLGKAPTRSFHDSGSGIRGTSGYQPITFTQDFSKVTGGQSAGRTEIHGFSRVPAPVVPSVSHRIPSRTAGTVGSIHKSEVHGFGHEITADRPRITFTQDFSKVSGQSQQIGIKPQIHRFDKTSFPITGTVGQHETFVDSHHKTGSHGISDVSQRGGVVFTRDFAGVHTTGPKPAVVSSGKFATGGVSTLRRPSFGSRVAGVQSNIPAQGFSTAAGPSKITFTQDFSRVTGQHTSPVKPVISIDGRLPTPVRPAVVASQEFQAVRRNTAKFTSPFETKPFRRPVAEIQAFKAPKQTVPEHLSFTSIQDQSFAQGMFPVRSDADKSFFAVGNAAGFDEGVKTSNFVVVPGAGVAHDKSTGFKHSTVGTVGKVSGAHHPTVGHSQFVVPSYGVSSAGEAGDKSKIFVAVPSDDYGHDKSSVLLHSSGVAPTGSFGEEKGSIVTLTSGEVHSGVSKQGQAQGYHAVSTPFKSYYTSSHPGYSHLSGESPRFDFSHDRSLLYTYNSPYLVSPFSYSYSSNNKYYDQGGSRKTVA